MRLKFLTMDDVQLSHKRVLIREDFNVPVIDGKVQNDLRIRAALPGIKQALEAKAQVHLISHLGRPEAGKWDEQYSLRPVAKVLQDLLNIPVKFVTDIFNPEIKATDDLILYENIRFLDGELENSSHLAKQLASLCDVFVFDAFGSAHRAHASTVGVIDYAPIAVAGPLLTQEVIALDRIMSEQVKPVLAIIGGSKVSTKFEILLTMVSLVDALILGGGIANTLLAANGHEVGNSLFEPELIISAKNLLVAADDNDCQILLPVDVIVDSGAQKDIADVAILDRILDIGPKTIELYSKAISQARTILWNGPVGVFEDPKFANGTRCIGLAIANSAAYSVAGGGDTIAAIEQFKITDEISYISTGGGAFLEYIEGKNLPSISALIKKSNHRVKTN